MLSLLTGFVVFAGGLLGGALLRPVVERRIRRRPTWRSYRRRLTGPRPGLAFYVIPPGLGDTDQIAAELTGGRRLRLCLLGRLCGPLPYDRVEIPETGLRRGALWVAPGLLLFDTYGDDEMSVLEAPYGIEAIDPLVTESGTATVTLDLGDGVLVFEPAPDVDAAHAWSRISAVLEEGSRSGAPARSGAGPGPGAGAGPEPGLRPGTEA